MPQVQRILATLGESNPERREVTARLYRFGERTRDGRNIGIAPGAFAGSSIPPLLYEHENVVGVGLSFAEDEVGGIGMFRVSETSLGNDAWRLVQDGAIRSVSIGFIPLQVQDGLVTEGELVEVSLVGVPAFRGADILEAASMEEDAIVETTVEEVTEAAAEVIEAAAEERVVPAAPPITGARVRARAYDSVVDLMHDTNLAMTTGRIPERLSSAIENNIISMMPGRGATIRLAFPGPATTGGDAAGVVPPGYIPDLLEVLRQGKRTAATLAGRNIGNAPTIQMPKIVQGSLVDYQDAQGDQVANQNVDTDVDTWNVATLAGGQGVSLHSQRFTQPDYMSAVMSDLIEQYASKLNFETLNGDGTGTGPNAHLEGIIGQAVDVPAPTDDVKGLLLAIGQAAASVHGTGDNLGTGRLPTFIIMTPQRYGWLIGQSDADGRPLVTTDFPENPVGVGDATVVGRIRGLNIVIDYDIPVNLGVGTNEDLMLVSNAAQSYLYEDLASPAQIALTYPDVLVTDVSVFGFSAVVVRRPQAWAKISGMVSPV